MSDLFPPGSSTEEASPTSSPKTSRASSTAISSPGLGDGPLPPNLLDGLPTGSFGLARVHVSLSRSRAKSWVPTIHGMCGPTSFASSAPAGPLQSWENRLRARLARVGSTESPLIWETRITPAGQPISRLRPWTPHKSASASTGSPWPAATAIDFARSDETIAKVQAKRFERAGQLTTPLYLGDVMRRVPEDPATWCAPQASMAGGMPEGMLRRKEVHAEKFGTGVAITELSLQMKATGSSPAPWPAVQANSAGNSSRSGDRKDELLLQGMMRENDFELGTWPAPTSLSFDKSHQPGTCRSMETTRELMASAVPLDAGTWAAPMARDGRGANSAERTAAKKAEGHGMAQLNDQMAQTAMWSAPKASEGNVDFAKAERSSTGLDLKTQMALQGVVPDGASTWRAPNVVDAKGGTRRTKVGESMVQLTHQMADVAQMALEDRSRWAAPRAGDWRSGSSQVGSEEMRPGGAMLPEQMSQTAVGGPTTVGSSATMGKPGGSPTPRFPCWLQGYPGVWLFCAPAKSLPKPKKARKRA